MCRCHFCNKTVMDLKEGEVMVQSLDPEVGICHSCVAKAQGLVAARLREKRWNKQPLLTEVPL